MPEQSRQRVKLASLLAIVGLILILVVYDASAGWTAPPNVHRCVQCDSCTENDYNKPTECPYYNTTRYYYNTTNIFPYNIGVNQTALNGSTNINIYNYCYSTMTKPAGYHRGIYSRGCAQECIPRKTLTSIAETWLACCQFNGCNARAPPKSTINRTLMNVMALFATLSSFCVPFMS